MKSPKYLVVRSKEPQGFVEPVEWHKDINAAVKAAKELVDVTRTVAIVDLRNK